MFNYLLKVLYVLPTKRTALFIMVAAFVAASSLEVFGIGMIGPFIALATNPDFVEKNTWLNYIYQLVGSPSSNQFTALLGCLIIILFCVKSFFYWCLQNRVFIFSYKQQGELSKKLMHTYMSAPYTFHLSKNSGDIIHAIAVETKLFADSILIPLLMTTSNVAVVSLLVLLLFSTSSVAIVAVLGMTIPLFIIFNYSKDKIKKWGLEARLAGTEIVHCINHGLGSIKETQVIGCNAYFEEQLSEQAERYTAACGSFYAFKLAPRILIETLLILFLVGFVSVYLAFNDNAQDLSSVLGIFAIASIRLIPAISNIATAMSTLRNQTATLDKLYFDLKEVEAIKPISPAGTLEVDPQKQTPHTKLSTSSTRTLKFHSEIALDSVAYRYPRVAEDVLRGISLNIKRGESIALIGRSGAGKTTLVDIILGLLIPQNGDIRVDGRSIYTDLRAWQNLVGYIPQSIFLMDDTIEKNIAFGVPEHLIDQNRLVKAIQAAHLTEVIDNLPNGTKTMVGERGILLSGGQRQRVGIARALYHEREILVLDEATAALDGETENLVTESIKSLGGEKTLIIIAHRLSTIEHCDRVYRLDKGRVIESGTYEEVVSGSFVALESEM